MFWDRGGVWGPTRVYGAGVLRGSHRVPCWGSGGGGDVGPTRVYGAGGSSAGPIGCRIRGWGSHASFGGVGTPPFVPMGSRIGGLGAPTRVYGAGASSVGPIGSHNGGSGGSGGATRVYGAGVPRGSHRVPCWGSGGGAMWVPRVSMGQGGVLRGSHVGGPGGGKGVPRVFMGWGGLSWVP